VQLATAGSWESSVSLRWPQAPMAVNRAPACLRVGYERGSPTACMLVDATQSGNIEKRSTRFTGG